MSALADRILRWASRLRVVSYGAGVAGAVMMLAAKGMEEPARGVWALRALGCFGLMMGSFLAYYTLAALRIYRR